MAEEFSLATGKFMEPTVVTEFLAHCSEYNKSYSQKDEFYTRLQNYAQNKEAVDNLMK